MSQCQENSVKPQGPESRVTSAPKEHQQDFGKGTLLYAFANDYKQETTNGPSLLLIKLYVYLSVCVCTHVPRTTWHIKVIGSLARGADRCGP